jgi:hypothetical protein
MKKKLLIILGAGSSFSCGLPSVPDLDLLMDGWSEAWATEHSFPNYYKTLGQEARAYYASGKTGLRPALNFEKVLGEFVALAHWMTPPPRGNTLRQVAAECAAPPSLQFPHPSDYGPSVTLNDQLRHLMMELARHIRGLSRRLDYRATIWMRTAAIKVRMGGSPSFAMIAAGAGGRKWFLAFNLTRRVTPTSF